MSKLKAIKLLEFGEVITGKTPSSKYPEDFGTETPFITPSDSFNQKHISSTNRYLSSEGVSKLKNKVLPANSVMVTCIGSAMGKVAMTNFPSITNQQINSIKVNKNFDANYVYYCLKNNYQLLRNSAKGSTALPLLNKTEFEKLKFNVHIYKKDQEKISSVMSVIDSKIEINNQINTELEAMAKMLYDYWFVQFDFPDADGKPYKSSGGKMVYNETLEREVPDGWKNGSLDDIGQIVGGSTPSTSECSNFADIATPWITPNDLSKNQGNKFISRGAQDVTADGIRSASLKTYPTGTVLLSSRAPIGYMAIAQNPLTTNQGFKSFIPNKGYSTEFVYYSVRNSLKTIEQYSSGSTFKEISGSVLKTVKAILPDSVMVDRYTVKAKAIFDQQNTLELENQQLSSLRDWLLPMLMNGQVTVSQ